jgi:citrate lyase gamma subunit
LALGICKSLAIGPNNTKKRYVRAESRKERKQAVRKEVLCTIHMLNIQAIAVKLRDAGSCNYDTWRIGEFDDVEG